MDNAGGDNEPTRLDRLETAITEMRERLANLETEFAEAKLERLNMDAKLDKLVAFADGTDKVFGFCRKHWRTILKFGCGFVTAYGISNPSIQHTVLFVEHFFGL